MSLEVSHLDTRLNINFEIDARSQLIDKCGTGLLSNDGRR